MLCRNTRGETIGTAEGDVARLDAAGHVVCFRCGVDDVIDGLHGEVVGHEFALHELLGEKLGIDWKDVRWDGARPTQHRLLDLQSPFP